MENFAGKFKTKPYRHQLDCLTRHGRERYFALLAEMGTGKTWIIINNIADLWSSNDCDAVLVFAPNGVHSNWTRLELPKHMPDWCRYHAVAWSSKQTKAQKAEIDSLYEPGKDNQLRIFTMNWEALATKRAFEEAQRFATTTRRLMIVCDESDAIKNPSAVRTKRLMSLKCYSHWRRIMTGTPINNAPFDAFAQFNFLNSSILETDSYYAFKSEYAEMLQQGHPLLDNIMRKSGSMRVPQVIARGYDGKPKYKNLDKLSRLIAPHSFRVLKKDCLDLPEKIYKTLSFDLTPQQKKVYKQAEKECRLTFEGETTPFNKLVALGKLTQITSGYYIHPLSEQPVKIEGANPKLDLLVDRVKAIIDEGEKVIIWARYRAEISDIAAALREAKVHSVQYHGGVGKDDRTSAIDDFENGDIPVFIGNQQAGGTGITLIAASYVIYFSNNFSLRDRLQSEDRAHRIGQTKNVTYINIVGKDTIDEKVCRTLTSKKDIADIIVDKGLKLFEEKPCF